MNLRQIRDAVSSQFNKIDENHYQYLKEGKPAYNLTKKDKHWECTCPAYKFHQKCKHADTLEAELKKNEVPDPAHQRHPRSEMEVFIPELEQICAPFKKWEIVGSWRRKCFAAGTKVRTLRGLKNIEDIEVGEEIFNGYGEVTKVTDLVSYKNDEWVSVNYRRASSILCTPDHQFLVWKSSSPNKPLEWVEAKDLKKSCKWKMVTPKLKLNESLSIGWEKAFILGWYLADGNLHWTKNKSNSNFKLELGDGGFYHLQLAANSIRSKELLHLVAELGLTDFSFRSNPGTNCLDIHIRQQELIKFVVEWGGFYCPELGKEKQADWRILDLIDAEKDAFMYGFWLGDGSYGKYNNSKSCRFYNTNIQLIEILDILLSRKFQTLRYERVDKNNYKTLYEVRLSGTDAMEFVGNMPKVITYSKYLDGRIKEKKSIDKGITFTPQNVSSVEPKKLDAMCYCLSVERGESFIANNFAVHNCLTFKDVDVIALADPSDWKQVHQNLVDSGAWEEFVFGDTLMRGMYHGYYLDFNLCPSEDVWLWWLIYRTGSADENTAMRSRAISMGYAISEKGVQDRFNFEYYPNDMIHSEEDFYHFFGYEYRPPQMRDGKNFKQLPNWNIEEHYSEGKKQTDFGDIDWQDYLLTTIEKVRGTNTVYSSAKYPARLAIVVAREIARRNGVTPEFVLSHITPEQVQPDGFKRGQQSWDKDGNIITVK